MIESDPCHDKSSSRQAPQSMLARATHAALLTQDTIGAGVAQVIATSYISSSMFIAVLRKYFSLGLERALKSDDPAANCFSRKEIPQFLSKLLRRFLVSDQF